MWCPGMSVALLTAAEARCWGLPGSSLPALSLPSKDRSPVLAAVRVPDLVLVETRPSGCGFVAASRRSLLTVPSLLDEPSGAAWHLSWHGAIIGVAEVPPPSQSSSPPTGNVTSLGHLPPNGVNLHGIAESVVSPGTYCSLSGGVGVAFTKAQQLPKAWSGARWWRRSIFQARFFITSSQEHQVLLLTPCRRRPLTGTVRTTELTASHPRDLYQGLPGLGDSTPFPPTSGETDTRPEPDVDPGSEGGGVVPSTFVGERF